MGTITDPVLKSQYNKTYYLRHRERIIPKASERQRLNSERYRNKNLKRKYGIDTIEYDRMLKSQDGKCKICGTDRPGIKGRRFAVDHNHVTGEVRGLLCLRCNLLIGHAKDDIQILQKAMEYLNGSKENPVLEWASYY